MKPVIITLSILVAVGCLGYGTLGFLAGSMSDAPQAGNDAMNSGLAIGAVGFAAVVIAILAAVFL